MTLVKWKFDDVPEPLPAKSLQVQVAPGQWVDAGFVSDLGATPDFTVEDATTTIQIKTTTVSPSLYKTLVGSNAYGDFGSTKADVAPELYLPSVKGLLPSTADEIPGDFPKVDLIGTPSPAKQKFIVQIEPCDGPPSPDKKLSVILKKYTPPVQTAPLGYDEMMAALEKMHQAAKGAYPAVQSLAQAFGKAQIQIHTAVEGFVGSQTNMDRAEQLHQLIPGVDEVVKPPCACGGLGGMTLWKLIQHLNDQHNPAITGIADPWSRERVADWLETLDVDLRVQDAPTPPPAPETAGWPSNQLEYLKAELAATKPHPGFIDSLKHPQLGLSDIVESAAPPKQRGRIVQYTYTQATDQFTYKVQWDNGGTSEHPREDLILVEAYSPPEPDIIDWGSKKITKTNFYPHF